MSRFHNPIISYLQGNWQRTFARASGEGNTGQELNQLGFRVSRRGKKIAIIQRENRQAGRQKDASLGLTHDGNGSPLLGQKVQVSEAKRASISLKDHPFPRSTTPAKTM